MLLQTLSSIQFNKYVLSVLMNQHLPNTTQMKKEPFPTPYNMIGAPRQRNMIQMKERITAPKKELSNKKIANLSDAQFKTLVIRVLTEMIELSSKMKEEMKATQSEIKGNILGTNSDG